MIFELYKSGFLQKMDQLGILKGSIIVYCKVFEYYLNERQKGNNYKTSVRNTADKLCVDERTVRRAITFLI